MCSAATKFFCRPAFCSRKGSIDCNSISRLPNLRVFSSFASEGIKERYFYRFQNGWATTGLTSVVVVREGGHSLSRRFCSETRKQSNHKIPCTLKVATEMEACHVCLGEGLLRRKRERGSGLKRLYTSKRERKRQRKEFVAAAMSRNNVKGSVQCNQEKEKEHNTPESLPWENNGEGGCVTSSTQGAPSNWSVLAADKRILVDKCSACMGTGLVPRNDRHVHKDDIVGMEDMFCTASNRNGQPSHAAGSTDDDETTSMRRLHISIIGGGIGGAALALALAQRDIPCTLYESDDSINVRAQGYGLTMQQGFRALGNLGLVNPYKVESDGYDLGVKSSRHVVCRSNGEIICEWGRRSWDAIRGVGEEEAKSKRGGCGRKKGGVSLPKRFNVHIPRQELRQRLLEQIPNHVIKWGHRLISYKESPSDTIDKGKVSLSFSVGPISCNTSSLSAPDAGKKAAPHCLKIEKKSTDILVGADGIWSQVRRIKFHTMDNQDRATSMERSGDPSPLRYLGCMVILGIAMTPSFSEGGLWQVDGETVFETVDGVARLYAMPFSSSGAGDGLDMIAHNIADQDRPKGCGTTMWQLSFPIDEEDAKAVSQEGSCSLKRTAFRRCCHWHQPVPQLISDTPTKLITGYPVYDREVPSDPSLIRGCDASRVTLMGDAAHPMSPFKGQGANQALLDAVLLARVLARAKMLSGQEGADNDSIIVQALKFYEAEMIYRCAPKVQASANAAQFLHSVVATTHGNMTRSVAFRDLGNKERY